VLLNDGLGTDAVTRLGEASFTLSETPGQEQADTWAETVGGDDIPPADFTVALAQVPDAFSGNYFITWSTLDKQTGIDHYELMEEPLEDFYAFTWGRVDAPWIRVESPYVLQDQTLNSTIRVKAIDKAGNETISVLVPDKALRSLSRDRAMTFIAVGAIAFLSLILIVYALMERKRRLMSVYGKDTE
jgi:hypothetical protein